MLTLLRPELDSFPLSIGSDGRPTSAAQYVLQAQLYRNLLHKTLRYVTGILNAVVGSLFSNTIGSPKRHLSISPPPTNVGSSVEFDGGKRVSTPIKLKRPLSTSALPPIPFSIQEEQETQRIPVQPKRSQPNGASEEVAPRPASPASKQPEPSNDSTEHEPSNSSQMNSATPIATSSTTPQAQEPQEPLILSQLSELKTSPVIIHDYNPSQQPSAPSPDQETVPRTTSAANTDLGEVKAPADSSSATPSSIPAEPLPPRPSSPPSELQQEQPQSQTQEHKERAILARTKSPPIQVLLIYFLKSLYKKVKESKSFNANRYATPVLSELFIRFSVRVLPILFFRIPCTFIF